MDHYNYDVRGLSVLVGKKITRIFMDEDTLTFHTTESTHGPDSIVLACADPAHTRAEVVQFQVDGDCCSYSYFYDFYGVRKLLDNGPVVSVRDIPLADPDDADSREGEVVAAYGFEIVTTHPAWGEQTAVFSFRNDSNGYYGGNLVRQEKAIPVEAGSELTDDCLQVKVR